MWGNYFINFCLIFPTPNVPPKLSQNISNSLFFSRFLTVVFTTLTISTTSHPQTCIIPQASLCAAAIEATAPKIAKAGALGTSQSTEDLLEFREYQWIGRRLLRASYCRMFIGHAILATCWRTLCRRFRASGGARAAKELRSRAM